VNRPSLALAALLGVALGVIGMTWWGGRAPQSRAGVEQVVRDYVLAHPELIPEAMAKLQQREQARAVAGLADTVTRPYAGAWAGNPRGDVTVVEYYDYNCGYCRASLPAIRQLVASDPGVRVVFRELPILAPTSRDAARASIAAARANRFGAFHDALYGGGRVTPASIAVAARTAGVDLSRADVAAADAEIERNLQAAGTLGLTGTPSWVIGGQLLSGAIPLDRLRAAVATARAERS